MGILGMPSKKAGGASAEGKKNPDARPGFNPPKEEGGGDTRRLPNGTTDVASIAKASVASKKPYMTKRIFII
jgi:hypothetical protein